MNVDYDSIGILTSESDLCWSRCPPFSAYPSKYLRQSKINIYNPQAVKDVRASQDTLINIFERIENFFRRLENYAAVPPTPEMMDIIGKIMVAILLILVIVTKEMKQGCDVNKEVMLEEVTKRKEEWVRERV